MLSGRLQCKTCMVGPGPIGANLSAQACLRSSWPASCRLSTSSTQQRRIQVFPVRVASSQETDLPSGRPTLEAGFSLDCRAYVLVVLEIHQPGQAISANKAASHTFSMLPNVADQVADDTAVQSAVPLIGHDVDPSCHARTICECGKEDVDDRHKAGHDGAAIGRRLKSASVGPSPTMTVVADAARKKAYV